MRRDRVRELLDRVASGALDVDAALAALDYEPVEGLPFATIDHHRALRQGFPEVVFGAGKTVDQLLAITERLSVAGDGVLVTRLDEAAREALRERFPAMEINDLARTAFLPAGSEVPPGRGRILIITAGTSDLPVAEEAAVTAVSMGNQVDRLTDVGVAGIHRLLAQGSMLGSASVVIVVAGMDGALPSVVGGLVRVPVIAVPTSVGYGAVFGGLAPLLTMLNSCAAGVAVVNIDNGFGAAVAASRITHG